MREGSMASQQISKDIEESLRHSGIEPRGQKPLEPEDFKFAEGTNPGIERQKVSKEAAQSSISKDEMSSILQGLEEAGIQAKKEAAIEKVAKQRQAEDEEKEWEHAIAAAKAKIAIEGDLPAQAVSTKPKVDLRQKIQTTLRADEQARQAAEEQRWEDKELAARRKLGVEAQMAEDRQKAEQAAREKTMGPIRKLMARLGLGKNKE